jgi:hypothetical protein
MALNVSLVHTYNVILSKKLSLQMPLPSSGYENIVLFENIHLVQGTYRILMSDTTSVYNFRGCNGLTIHPL